MTWALNHLNYFLTTKLLLDCLKTNPNGGRIINVSSNAHITGKVDVQALRDGRVKGGWTTYADTKLANILFTNELARRLQGTNITANAMHPGFVATSFGHDNRGVLSWLLKLSQKVFARTPEEGAKTVTYLAASPEVQGVTGKYFVDCRPATPIPAARNPETARELWEWSEAITVEKMPA
jgi:NAD(P)-dependent dehydrogenase (short-subunit alcohol dehydrogenase family)